MTLRCRYALALAALLLAGCSSLPSIPVPWSEWFSSGPKKPGPLPVFDTKASAQVNWQLAIGSIKGASGYAPAVRGDTVFAASPEGTIISAELRTGRQNWRISTGAKSHSSGAR